MKYLNLYVLIVFLPFLIPNTFAQDDFTVLGRWAYGQQNQIYVDGNTGFISSGASLIISNFTDPLHPVELSTITVSTFIDDFILIDSLVYLADRSTLWIYDVRNPSSPGLITTKSLDRTTIGLHYDGSLLYQVSSHLLTGFDLDDQTNPQPVFTIPLGAYQLVDLAFKGDYIYGCERSFDDNFVYIINVSDRDTPETTQLALSDTYINTVEIIEPYLYVGGKDSLYILDISNPGLPVIEEVIFTGWIYDIAIYGDQAFFSRQGHGANIYDISNPLLPDFISGTSAWSEKVGMILSYIFQISGGSIAIFDISDLTNPRQVSMLNYGGYLYSIEINDGYGFIPTSDDVHILDLRDPESPYTLSSILQNTANLQIENQYCYLANRWDGWSIADISDPSNPVIVSSTNSKDRVEDIRVDGNYIYLADWGGGIRIYDISDPANPLELGNYVSDGDFEALEIIGSNIYTWERDFGLKILDISDKMHPVLTDSIAYSGSIEDIVRYDTLLFLATGGGRILNISDPSHPVDLNREQNWWSATALEITNDTLYVTQNYQGLEVYALADPLAPEYITSFTLPYSFQDVKVRGNTIYLLDRLAGLYILQFNRETTSIPEEINSGDKLFTIFPNPATDHLWVELFNSTASDTYLSIYDSQGRIHYQQKMWTGVHSTFLDVGGWLPGIYFVSFKNQNQAETRKLFRLR
jgi:hypothetical protein